MNPSAHGSRSQRTISDRGRGGERAGSRPGSGSRGRPESPRSRRRRSARARAVSSTSSGAPKAIWRRFRHRTRSHARAWSTSCVAIRIPRPSSASSASSCSSRSALGWSTPVNGSSRSRTGASCTSARATSTRWRCPPESSPNWRRACSARPTRPSAARAAARPPAPGPLPPRQARQRAHQRDVERADRVVEPRALGLGHVPERARRRETAVYRGELAEQGPEQRRLAAAVRAEHADPLPGLERERDVLEHGRPAVSRRQPLDLEQRRAHPAQLSLPPVKPRTIASAFARSIER